MPKFTFLVATATLAAIALPAQAQMTIPTDMAATCMVEPARFASWFTSGTPGANAPVNPVSSVTFTTDNSADNGPNVCNFYQWGAQMFMWLTSPEGDGIVLDGPSIFTVTPTGPDGKRTLIPNTTGATYQLSLRGGKTDDIGEVGQAGSNGVLLSQQGALVYYGIHANDVYGYFLSGQMTGAFPDAKDFPRNAEDLKEVLAYAGATYGVDIPNPQALAIEMKTSWVDAATLPSPEGYVTIEAEIPIFTPSSDNLTWQQATTAPLTKTATMALVGIHIVGTVQDHPEFVWATFEHISNAPDAGYYYTKADDTVAMHPFSSDGSFAFMATGGTEADANKQCMRQCGATIVAANDCSAEPAAICQGGIVASDTVRNYPWGSAANDQSAAVLKNNTLLLSVNNSVRSQMVAGDLRANYVQTGGIWTTTPSAGADAPIPNWTGDQSANLRGSLHLSNATMETYTQGTSCFSCHNLRPGDADSFVPFGLSHIFSTINPLVKY